MSITDSLGRSVNFATDVLGRVTSIMDPLGNRTTTAYDALSRIASRTDALGQQVSFGYDPNGNLTSFTDARNNVTSFAYDVHNRVITRPTRSCEEVPNDPACRVINPPVIDPCDPCKGDPWCI